MPLLPAPEPRPDERARPRVLVAYASKHGSTRQIAEEIGAVLAAAGLEVDVRPAGEVRTVAPYAAVVLGSGLYAATWLREANRFVRAHAAALRQRPVWLFSSGPLDQSARLVDIPMTPHVAAETAAIEVRGHRTFGGRLDADTPGLDPAVLHTHRTGDFRDWEAIRAWGGEIAEALR